MTICLFAHHTDTNTINTYVYNNINKILNNFSVVYFLTNVNCSQFRKMNFNSNVKYKYILGRIDFEKYIKFFKQNKLDLNENLCLLNDTIFIEKNNIQSLIEFDGISGYTISLEPTFHIQSYFLSINKKYINSIFNYLMAFNSFDDKDDVINYCEVGLSKYIMNNNIPVKSLYQTNEMTNPTYLKWIDVYKNIYIMKRNFFNKTYPYNTTCNPDFILSYLKSNNNNYLYHEIMKFLNENRIP